MQKLLKKKGRLLAVFLLVSFLAALPAQGALRQHAIKAALMQQVLTLAGLRTQLIELYRSDGFEQGVLLEDLAEAPILIGFPKDGIQAGKSLLVAFDGREALVELSEDGTPVFIEQDDDILDIISMVLCLLNAINTMVEQIDACGGDTTCTFIVIIAGILSIVQCTL